MDLEPGLELVRELGGAEHWLATLTTVRADGTPGVSVVNAGVLAHPLDGEPVVAFVARGRTAKLRDLRRNPASALVFRHGWEWVGVHGSAELAGPDDPLPGLAPDDLPGLLRDIYHAAGGEHPDLAEYDREMAVDRRTAVLVRPVRFSVNPGGTEHREPHEPPETQEHR